MNVPSKFFSCVVAVLALLTTEIIFVEPCSAKSGEVYLDKLDKSLDDWWNALDNVCRGEPGGSEASDLACKQRLEVDKILIRTGCRNVYPATNPNDTSYWICKPKK
jgi:hypothetical protein